MKTTLILACLVAICLAQRGGGGRRSTPGGAVRGGSRRWLDLGVGYKYSENDSDAVGKSYERNIFSISATASTSSPSLSKR